MSELTGSFTHLNHDEQAIYAGVVATVRNIVASCPQLGAEMILNALVATGSEDLTDQIQVWADTVHEIEPRERAAYCHGNGPHADRIISLPRQEELWRQFLPKFND